MGNKYRFRFVGFNQIAVLAERQHEVSVSVIAEDEVAGLERAKKLVVRDYYQLIEVIEEV